MTDLASSATRVSIAGFDAGAAGITPPSNPDRRGVFLADVVVELGLADQEAISSAVEAAKEAGKSLERYLLDAGILDEEQLCRAIAERNGLDHVDLDRFAVDMEAAGMVNRSAAQRYGAVPVAFASDGALIVAVEDPFDTLGISDIEVMTRSEVRPAIASASGIDALIERLPEQPVAKPAPGSPDHAANGEFHLRRLPEPRPDSAAEMERKIEELKGAEERAQRLERELRAAQGRIEELEGRLSAVDTAARELGVTTEKLNVVRRALERSSG
jgi:MshEN domain